MKTNQELILESIAHWERMRDDWSSERASIYECALCQRYYDYMTGCDGCPIKEKTRQNFCRETPYHKADVIQLNLLDLRRNQIEPTATQLAEWKLAAQAEIDFLKSLL